MCGFAALYDPDLTVDEGRTAAMRAALRHRGPDGEDQRRLGPAVLIHTRLAIIDVAGGDQPLWSEDRACAVVVNGEIYNHREIRRELERHGHRFATASDCEVLVHLYEEEGLDAVRRLNGMFGFALWDAGLQRLWIARDPFGVKPVYWWSDGRRFAAASEISAILATGLLDPAVDDVALDHFLAWRFVPAPRTLFRGISKLPAATMLTLDSAGVQLRGYREPPRERHDDHAPQELEEELCRQFAAAVERQMMSDVPYGAFLSGGLDSAAIVAAMRGAVPAAPKTFTIGFPGQGGAVDEREDAARTGELLDAEHRTTEMTELDFPEQLSQCIARLEDPCGIPSAPALLQLSHFARRHVKVVLSGQGADEPLGGYQRHQAAALLRLVGGVPPQAAEKVRSVALALPRNERAKRAAHMLGRRGTDALLSIFEVAPPSVRQALVGRVGDEAVAERMSLAEGVLADVPGAARLEQALYLDTHLLLPDGLLIYGDKMSMAYGLEQRVPFLDVEFMRFVERVPAHLRVRRLRRKWLYRRALTSLLPAEIVNRRKRPFATPYDRWLRQSLGDELSRRWQHGAGVAELVAPAAVQRLVEEHRSGRADHKRVLYCLLELAHWHDAFIDRTTRQPVTSLPAGI
jgi:asparagine synthase (glutamine-hydrolysing)